MRLNGDSKIMNSVLSASCCLAVLLAIILPVFGEASRRIRSAEEKVIQLPEPNKSGAVGVETAINTRRSAQQFADKPLNYAQIGQLLWAGQGIIDKQQGLRAAPSADAMYPIELYLVTHEGLFVYNPEENSLKQISTLDMRKQLSVAASGQGLVENAACDIIIAGSIRKAATKYGNKAQRFVLLEAGYVAENIQLQTVSMGLTSLPVGSFEPRNITRICELPGELEPLLIVCVGYPFVQQKTQDQAQSAVQTTKKAVIIVTATQYADAELVDIQRVLKEAGIIPVFVSSKIGTSQGAFGGIAASEITFDKLNVGDFDAVVFIGGLGDVDYFNNPAVLGIAREASAKNKVIAAISNATTILANAGVLRGIRATGLPQQQDQMKKAGAQYTGSAVERDGPIITANDSSVAVQFARTIVTAIKANQPKSDITPTK
jgi:SagB-type dehydrogenase family enzyme